jgi:uncharacterized sulfatase
MYDEITRIPFIVRCPGEATPRGAASQSLVSQVDVLPTMLDLAGIDVPPSMHGVSLVPALRDPAAAVREMVLIGWHRFAINHDDWGEFHPIRCVTDGRHKLAINLFDTDEFYDLDSDPHEMVNRIDEPALAAVRDSLHDRLLDEMDRIRDPFRGFRWGDRPWRSVRKAFYHGGARREKPRGFPFEPRGIGADGSR